MDEISEAMRQANLERLPLIAMKYHEFYIDRGVDDNKLYHVHSKGELGVKVSGEDLLEKMVGLFQNPLDNSYKPPEGNLLLGLNGIVEQVENPNRARLVQKNTTFDVYLQHIL